ncbi:hypothetical protein MUO14_20825 [Halobacillus shinanisalinarum]|uniref:Uncharacterized protein n=1 Tax=Halobacillus shinanisalinarum TaxID=2932258 RepID=A0ABY4GXL6_9BACI|nr:hypothetical protein [Halobacillus shinanisalinarum]UOQ92828.1 hypothetical protein MUO14_20825 [Halobacillus shinanisalinarum]
MVRWLLFLIGFGFSVAGGTVTITYLNLIPAGLTWIEFLLFIRSRPECYLFPIGIVLISFAILLMNDSFTK